MNGELYKMPAEETENKLNNEVEEEQQEEDLFLEILKGHLGDEFELNPEGKKDFDPYIIIDKREVRSGIGDELKEMGAHVIEETLETGDYFLSSKAAVERKRGDDFYGSLFSGSNQTNVFQELIRLSDMVESPMMILEDFGRMFSRGDKMKSSLYGALVAIATQMGIPIIPTRDISDTALVLFRTAKQQQEKKDLNAIARRAPKTISVKDRQAFFLEGFYHVGPKRSEQLIQEFNTPIGFITSLMNTQILYTRTGNPKGIDGKLGEIKGFGWKFVQDNKNLLMSDEEE